MLQAPRNLECFAGRATQLERERSELQQAAQPREQHFRRLNDVSAIAHQTALQEQAEKLHVEGTECLAHAQRKSGALKIDVGQKAQRLL